MGGRQAGWLADWLVEAPRGWWAAGAAVGLLLRGACFPPQPRINSHPPPHACPILPTSYLTPRPTSVSPPNNPRFTQHHNHLTLNHPQITEFFSFDIFYYVVIGYTGLVVCHAVITTRDGYCVSISNMAAARLRRWRRDPRGCCGAGWTPLIWMLERIGASSARPVAQEYLAPYHMKVGGAGVGCRCLGLEGLDMGVCSTAVRYCCGVSGPDHQLARIVLETPPSFVWPRS